MRSRCVHAARDRVCVFFKAERRPAVCVRHVFLARTCQQSCPRLLLAVGAAPDVGAPLPLTARFQPPGACRTWECWTVRGLRFSFSEDPPPAFSKQPHTLHALQPSAGLPSSPRLTNTCSSVFS